MGKKDDALHMLGCDSNSTKDDLRKAYKAKALQVHPDKNFEDPEATEKFQELSEAYSFLLQEDEGDDDVENWCEGDEVLAELLMFFRFLAEERRRRYFDAMYGDSDGEGYTCSHCGRCYGNEDAGLHVRSKSVGGGAYNFACEQGEGPPKLRGKAKKQAKQRQPRQKTARVMTGKKKNKLYRAEYYESISQSVREEQLKAQQEKRMREERRAEEERRREREHRKQLARQPQQQQNQTGAEHPPTAPPYSNQASCAQIHGKNKSKKQLLAEQKKREKEMAELAVKLKEESERELARQNKEKTEKQSKATPFRQSKHALEREMAEQLELNERRLAEEQQLLEAAYDSPSSKSRSRRRKEAKQRRRAGARQPQQNENTAEESEESASVIRAHVRLPTYSSDFRWGMADWKEPECDRKPSSLVMDTKSVPSSDVITLDNYPRELKVRAFNKGVTKRSFRNGVEGHPAGNEHERVGLKSSLNRPKPQSRLHHAQETVSGLSEIPMAGAPRAVRRNVWEERWQWQSEEAPVDAHEEEAMLRAALQLSQLHAQEESIKRQMQEDEQAAVRRRKEEVQSFQQQRSAAGSLPRALQPSSLESHVNQPNNSAKSAAQYAHSAPPAKSKQNNSRQHTNQSNDQEPSINHAMHTRSHHQQLNGDSAISNTAASTEEVAKNEASVYEKGSEPYLPPRFENTCTARPTSPLKSNSTSIASVESIFEKDMISNSHNVRDLRCASMARDKDAHASALYKSISDIDSSDDESGKAASPAQHQHGLLKAPIVAFTPPDLLTLDHNNNATKLVDISQRLADLDCFEDADGPTEGNRRIKPPRGLVRAEQRDHEARLEPAPAGVSRVMAGLERAGEPPKRPVSGRGRARVRSKQCLVGAVKPTVHRALPGARSETHTQHATDVSQASSEPTTQPPAVSQPNMFGMFNPLAALSPASFLHMPGLPVPDLWKQSAVPSGSSVCHERANQSQTSAAKTFVPSFPSFPLLHPAFLPMVNLTGAPVMGMPMFEGGYTPAMGAQKSSESAQGVSPGAKGDRQPSRHGSSSPIAELSSLS